MCLIFEVNSISTSSCFPQHPQSQIIKTSIIFSMGNIRRTLLLHSISYISVFIVLINKSLKTCILCTTKVRT